MESVFTKRRDVFPAGDISTDGASHLLCHEHATQDKVAVIAVAVRFVACDVIDAHCTDFPFGQ